MLKSYKLYFLLTILTVVVILADILTTKINLSVGFVEANPIARFLLANNVFISLKLATLAGLIWGIKEIRNFDELSKIIVIIGILIVDTILFLAVLNNVVGFIYYILN